MNEHDFQANPVNITVCADPAYCGKVHPSTATPDGAALGAGSGLFQVFKDRRNELGLKGKVMVQKTSCQGWCDYAPVMTVWPDGRVYHDIKPEEAERFIKEAALEDKGTFDGRKVWDFRKGEPENRKERTLHGVTNPAHPEA